MARRKQERCEACGAPMYVVGDDLLCLADGCPDVLARRDMEGIADGAGLALRVVLGIVVLLIKLAVLYAAWKVLTQ